MKLNKKRKRNIRKRCRINNIETLLNKQNNKCFYCKREIFSMMLFKKMGWECVQISGETAIIKNNDENKKFLFATIEHKIPLYKKGGNLEDNLLACCSTCNHICDRIWHDRKIRLKEINFILKNNITEFLSQIGREKLLKYSDPKRFNLPQDKEYANQLYIKCLQHTEPQIEFKND